MRWSRTRAFLVAASVVVSACVASAPGAAGPTEEPVATPWPGTIGPTVDPTGLERSVSSPAPTAPASFDIPADTAATTEADGIRLTIELDRVPLTPGIESWATMTVTNEASETLRYGVGGCDIAIFVEPVPSGFLLEGLPQDGLAAAFKADALRQVGLPTSGRFTVEHLIGRDVACADYYMPKRIRPGRTITQRALWEPATDMPTRDIPVTIVASFRYEWRGQGAEPELGSVVITARLPSAVIGGGPWPWLTPAEAVDVALDDPEFAAWVADVPTDQPPWSASVTFDPVDEDWVVQGFRELASGWIAELRIDAETGQIIDRRFD